jgi:homoserine acetyltransferase
VKNAVLLIHGTTGTGKEFLAKGFRDAMFGPGQPLDAAKYYLILPDAIGLGGSSKPSDGLHDRFPRYGYKDMVAAEERLVTEGLGIKHLRLVFGISMGGMQVALGRTIPSVNGRNHPGGLPAGQNCGSESALAPYHYNGGPVGP